MKKKTLYDFLGVEPEASQEEIKAAALYLAKKYHPVSYPGNSRVAARFKQIKLVYNILTNPQKRANYDASLATTTEKKAATRHKKNTQKEETPKFLNGEQILYSVEIHWFGYLDAFLFMLIPAYFIFFDPALLPNFLEDNYQFWQDKRLYVEFGLIGLLLLSILRLLQTLLKRTTSTLMITAERTIAKFGFISIKTIEITHAQFEELEIKQSLLGKILDFGKIKIRGRGKKGFSEIKIKVSEVVSPKQFENRLMRVIKHSAYRRICNCP